MNCAIYIRKSREDKSKPGHRLTVQRQQLPAHANVQGWTPVVYDDGHASAARGKTEDLQQRNRLEADICAGKIDIILTIELSRLSRDDSMQDYVGWLHLCSQHGVKLATMSRILDPAQHSDWMLLLMEGGFSSVEMKVLQTRMREGRAEAFRAGKYLSGNPPMPYIYDKQLGGLRIDPEQIETFQQAVSLAENHSVRKIAEKLNLPLSRVRRITADDRLLFYQGKRLDRDTGEEIDGQWPAVITADQAESIRKNRKAGHRNPRRSITGMLANLGIITCNYCGRSVRTWANGKPRKDGTKLEYYGCRHMDKRDQCQKSRMVPQYIIDDLVIINLANTLANIEQLKTYWLEQNSRDNIPDKIEKIKKELAILQGQKTRLISAITEGIIEFADAKIKRLELDAVTNACKKRLKEFESQTEDQPTWESIDFSKEEIDLLAIEEKRELFPLAISNISLSSSRLIITYKFPRHADGRRTAEIKLPPAGKTNPQGHWKIK